MNLMGMRGGMGAAAGSMKAKKPEQLVSTCSACPKESGDKPLPSCCVCLKTMQLINPHYEMHEKKRV